MDSPTPPAGCAVLDALRFRLRARYATADRHPLDTLRHRLAERGELAPGPDRSAVRLRLAVPGWEQAPPEVDLGLSEGPGWVAVLGHSEVMLNPLRAIRRQHAGHVHGPLGLDRRDNTVGPTRGREALLLGLQLDYVGAVAEAVAVALAAGLPADAVAEEGPLLWVSSAEACADLAWADPRARVAALRRRAPPGVCSTTHSTYAGHVESDGVSETIRHRREGAPFDHKIYAKTREAVRAEIACRSRDEVAALHGGERPSALLDREGARKLVLGFVEAASVHLRELVRFVTETRAMSPADVVLAVLPLVQMAAGGAPGVRSPPQAASVAAARACLDGLLERGWCALPPMDGEAAVAKCLERLAADGGPLVRASRRRRYVLR